MYKFFITKVIQTFLLLFLISPQFIIGQSVLAHSEPEFPSCASKIFSSIGDHDHSENGNFYIIGDGWKTGTDDVYSLENGNFLQCFCPSEGFDGIQSNWWDVDSAGLSDNEISNYKSQGWYQEYGPERNLPNHTFLVKNKSFSCNQPTPVPTKKPQPSTTPMPTVTPIPGPQSRCFDLEAEPSEGSVPLTVKFTAHADDPVTNGKIKEYKFDFGDASGGQPQVWSSTDSVAYHRYELSGNYIAKVDIQDNAGNWRGSEDCRVEVKVKSTPNVLGASTPNELPSTGGTLLVVISSLSLTGVGYFLTRHFRLV